MSKIVTTQDANRMICDLLIAAVERWPDWQFGQILRNLELVVEGTENLYGGWKDDSHTPSLEMLSRAGKYKDLMRQLGAQIDGNSRMAIKRLKLHKKDLK